MKMNNMKIKARLLISFLIVVVLAVSVGMYGIVSINNLTEDSARAFENSGNSQGYLGNILGNFAEMRFIAASVNLMDDSEAAVSYKAELDSLYDEALEQMAAYEKTLATDQEFAEYEQIVAGMDWFHGALTQVMDLAIAGDFDASKSIIISDEATREVNALSSVLRTARNGNYNQAQEALGEMKAEGETASLWMIILLAVAVIASVVMAIVSANSIARPMGKLVHVADKVSKGIPPEEGEIKGLVARDEVGQMAASVQSIVDTLNRLLADISMLTEASVQGKLSTRADASVHEGAFNMMVGGINNILDAVIAPVMEASSVLEEMAKGNLQTQVAGDYQGDHALIKDSLNSTIETLRGYISEISGILSAMAEGDFSAEITREYLGEFMALRKSINAIGDSLSEVMRGINTAAEQVASGTQQVSDGAQATSQGATEQASSIEELTATITQIAEQTRQNALNANDANQQSNDTRGFAQEGSALMDSMQDSMREINEASGNISKIIRVIDDISFKTNILALNAAVEAAHAGVHGKGFAVVAEQVGDLAGQSAQATQETTDLIENSIKKAETGTRLARDTGESLKKIVTGVDKAGEVIGQIAVASNEQATGIAQINKGIEQLSQVVQTNSATAQEAAAAAEELSSQAELLKQMVARFRLKGEKSFSAPGYAPQPQPQARETARPAADKKATIVLSDSDFGKY